MEVVTIVEALRILSILENCLNGNEGYAALVVAEMNTSAKITNTYSLEDVSDTINNIICAFRDGGAQISTDCKILTDSYMKTQDFVNDLNSGNTDGKLAWKLNPNGGYPILQWQE